MELNFEVREYALGHFRITAELLNPVGTVRAVLSDLSFTLRAVNISNFSYNPAFDSQFFGDATVNLSPSQIHFTGMNTIPPLNNQGGPDSSNPLLIGEFQANRLLFPWEEPCFEFHGQITGALVGSPFDEILFYQNADGSPGNTPYTVIACQPPAPGTIALLGFAGFAVLRRCR